MVIFQDSLRVPVSEMITNDNPYCRYCLSKYLSCCLLHFLLTNHFHYLSFDFSHLLQLPISISFKSISRINSVSLIMYALHTLIVILP